MKSDALTKMAVEWARDQWPDAVIVRELSVGSWGTASLDLGIITDTDLIGIEVKGEGDSPSRLKLQGIRYSVVCSRMYLLPSPEIADRCWKQLPAEWLELYVHEKGLREGAVNHIKTERNRPPTSPYILTECLWRPELEQLAKDLGHPFRGRYTREDIGYFLSENIPLKTLRPAIYSTLRQRKWRRHYYRGRVSLPETLEPGPAQRVPA